jgi:hypothetical protein
LEKLAVLVGQRGLFDQQALERQLDKVWQELYYRLPAFGWSPTLAHMRAGGPLTWSKFHYLFATALQGKVGGHKRT